MLCYQPLMAEPSRRTSRLTIAGAALALIAAGAGGFALGRGSVEAPAVPPAAKPAAPAPAPALPTVQPPLARADLIAAAARAADAFAAGRPLPQELAELVGREFELRLPFGCSAGPEGGSGPPQAVYDPAEGVLRVRAEPVRWAPEEWLPRAAGATEVAGDAAAAAPAETIEGFWVARPWTSSEVCPPEGPVSAAGSVVPGAPEQTLGIARIFTPEGSRVGRRDGKAYEAVERVAPEAFDKRSGLQLRLRGKLARASGASPVMCRAQGGARPVCLLVAEFDEVAIENPASKATIATWDVSSQIREPGSG